MGEQEAGTFGENRTGWQGSITTQEAGYLSNPLFVSLHLNFQKMRFTILLICLVLAGTSGNLIAQSTKPKASTSKPTTTKKPTQTSTKPKASAQKTPSKEGCTSGNCKNGYGTFVYPDTLYTTYLGPKVRKIKYIGNFVDGKREGQGTTYYGGQKEGELAKIEGIWKDDDSFDAVAYDAKNKVLDVIRGGESTSKTKKAEEKLPCAISKEFETSIYHTHSISENSYTYNYYIYSVLNQKTSTTIYIAIQIWKGSNESEGCSTGGYTSIGDAKSAISQSKRNVDSEYGSTNLDDETIYFGYISCKGLKADAIITQIIREHFGEFPKIRGCFECNGFIYK